MCTAGFDSATARCAACLPDKYLIDGTCEPCQDVAGGFVIARWVVSGVVQLLFIIAFYINVNRPKAASQGTVESIIDFVQIVQTLSRLDIDTPITLQRLYDALNILTIPGFIKQLELKPECLFGTFGGSIMFNILQQTSAPLILFANIAMMQVLFVMCGKTLRRDFVHNMVCLVFANMFISLVALSLSLFYTERMPNGKDMVVAFPQLEHGEPEWMLYLPINLFATCLYGLSTYSYVAYTVLTAPRRIGTEPGFHARYRFCFGTKRPDRWWWIMVKMSFGLLLCLVQVVLPANNVHSHVYTSALFMFAMTVVMYGAWPWKFDSNNWVELMCKIALIVLLMLTTAFIDVDSVPQSDRVRMNEVWAHVIILTLGCAFVFAFALYVRDIVSSMQQIRIKQVRTARAMWHLRDMSLALLMMPENEYAKRLAAIGDSDRALLMEVNKNIKNVIFGQQESTRWIQQRLIAGKEHEVWDHGQRVLGFLRESKSGRLQERLEQSMRFRRHVLELAKAISQSSSNSSRPVGSAGSPHILRSVNSSPGIRSMTNRSSIGRHHAAIRDVMQPTPPLGPSLVGRAGGIIGRMKDSILSEAEMTQDDFKRKISNIPELNMPEEEINTLFRVLDSNGSGTVTYQRLTDLLAALAPEKVLRAMGRNDDGYVHDSGDLEEEKEEAPSERGFGGKAATAFTVVATGNDEPAEEAIEI
jgi:hypothetical protein